MLRLGSVLAFVNVGLRVDCILHLPPELFNWRFVHVGDLEIFGCELHQNVFGGQASLDLLGDL